MFSSLEYESSFRCLCEAFFIFVLRRPFGYNPFSSQNEWTGFHLNRKDNDEGERKRGLIVVCVYCVLNMFV